MKIITERKTVQLHLKTEEKEKKTDRRKGKILFKTTWHQTWDPTSIRKICIRHVFKPWSKDCANNEIFEKFGS